MFKTIKDSLTNQSTKFLIILGILLFIIVAIAAYMSVPIINSIAILGFYILLASLFYIFRGKRENENKITRFRKRIIVAFVLTALMSPLIGIEQQKHKEFDDSYKFNGSFDAGYPIKCKGTCGREIKSNRNDFNGYHLVCKPGKNGKSTLDKAKGY